jgi:Protein of unknown function (DUF3800)
MATFTAYFDESGTHDDSSNVVMGGYIAEVDQWTEFAREWSRMKAEDNIDVFHRVAMENFKGEFKNWSRERLVACLHNGHEIIKRRTNIGIGGSVLHVDFDEVMPDVIKRAFGGPYGWLAQECLVGVGHWAIEYKRSDPIQYVFESGARGRHQVDRMMEILYKEPFYRDLGKIGGWSFQPKESVIQLQSADWFAYEIYKHVENRIVDGPKRPIRKSALDLMRRWEKPHFWDRNRLARWVADAAPLVDQLERREAALRSIGRNDLI